ncbi:hypothetical protein NFI96_007219 [Prochilodus magdalenae]|nr:hypothetical protein NFI96_007219 [Prochilodus magdalenae]
MLTAQDMSYDEARNLHSKWLKHQAFMAELQSNKEWLDKIQKDGTALVSEKPETEAVVKEKLEALKKMWDELESTTQTKAQCLFDANKAELFTQSCADLDKWLSNLEGQIQSDDFGKDLTSVNILLKKQQGALLRDSIPSVDLLEDRRGGSCVPGPVLVQGALLRDSILSVDLLEDRRGGSCVPGPVLVQEALLRDSILSVDLLEDRRGGSCVPGPVLVQEAQLRDSILSVDLLEDRRVFCVPGPALVQEALLRTLSSLWIC